MKSKPIKTLIHECEIILKQLRYSDTIIFTHKTKWINGICVYMRERNMSEYTTQIGKDYLEVAIKYTDKPSTKRMKCRNIRILDDCLLSGTVRKHIVEYVSYPLLGEIGNVSEEFLSHLRYLRRSELTISGYRRILSNFITGLDLKCVTKVADIKEEHILDYIAANSKNKKSRCSTLRIFCKYMYSKQITTIDLSYVLNNSRIHTPEKIPSLYSAEEVLHIEKSVNQSSFVGKRDYAILLLATRLGLRASDIGNLTFSNICWDTNIITIIQHKTGRPIELPLLAEVGEAIVNYLKYSRPASDLPQIFLMARAPHDRLDRMSVNSAISSIIKRSGIVISNRKFGPHAMRHTLACQLLRKGTSLPIISESLGHKTTQSTMNYLRVDFNNLLKCTLDIPIVNDKFYNQKGGVFYE